MSKPRSSNGILNSNGKFGRAGGRRPSPVLITGGAGFIGTNLAHRLLSSGQPVLLFDNLSRPGVERNLQWLQKEHGSLVRIDQADIRRMGAVRSAVKEASKVFHFAAQVAVTTSLDDPIEDFEINARGTLNLLEAVRNRSQPIPLLFTSTNKVYGDLSDLRLQVRPDRYEPADGTIRRYGVSESRALAFHSPYGCSKGAACQYVLDYAHTFKLPCAVFRMSCIYGPHQFGNEDQGWVAHFLIRALEGIPITIYGDGRQVRDILFVEDLVDAFLAALNHIEAVAGSAFNIGGGTENTISLLELLNLIEEVHGAKPETEFEVWRPADQQYYVSDIRRFSNQTGWSPKVRVPEGIERLYQWLVHSCDSPLLFRGETKNGAVFRPHDLRSTSRPREKGNGLVSPARKRQTTPGFEPAPA
jgi:CDP-paratose 2-epimerase